MADGSDKCGWSNQDTVTCVQRENDDEQPSMLSPPSNICHGEGLVAEVERRRERDFGPARFPVQITEIQSCYRHGSKVMKPSQAVESSADTTHSLERKMEMIDTASTLQTQGEPSSTSDGSSPFMTCSPLTPRGAEQPSPPLRPSLFPRHLPPTIHFPLPHENCELMGGSLVAIVVCVGIM